jgi:crotonobetainyl-CoA:carnitine CoA-transferase CaiB-like acyl-CoA transferase
MDQRTSVFFRNLNRGKQSVVLDLKQAADREALLRLTDRADVLVESFRPGVAARLGVGYEAVSERNPGIVYCSITAFGQHGAYGTATGARSRARGADRRAEPDARR